MPPGRGAWERKPSMYKRILVATGGSPWSDAAVAYAIRLAASIGAEVVLVTVLTLPVSYGIPETGIVNLMQNHSQTPSS
jgi:nucleotide-binding universal stress UspA family protein